LAYFAKKKWGFYIKRLVVFLPFFAKRGGGLGQSKKSLSEKTEVVKKGGKTFGKFVGLIHHQLWLDHTANIVWINFLTLK